MKRGKTPTLTRLKELARSKGCGVDPFPKGDHSLQLFWLSGLHCMAHFYLTSSLSRANALRAAFAALSALPDTKPAPKAGKGER